MIKKLKNINEFFKLKFLPLNTNLLFHLNNNKTFLFFNLEIYNIPFLLNLKKILKEYNVNIDLISIIFHKVKNYEEYLVYDLDIPIYILFDIFEITFYKNNKQYLLTNKNFKLEIIDIETDLILKPIIFGFNDNNEIFFITEENFENFLINEIFLFNNPNISNFSNNNYILNRKNIIDFKIENNLILVLLYNNFSSYLHFFDLDFNLKYTMEFSNDFISFDSFYLNNKEFILTIYSMLNKKIIFYKILIESNNIKVINQKEFKSKIDDIIYVKLVNNFVILSSFNRIYFYRIVPESKQLINIFEEDTNLFPYNVSGYNTSFDKKIVDGQWRETIWGNIKDITINENIIFVSDNQYSDIRYLDINTGKSYHIKIKGINNYENIKGKILSIFYFNNYNENTDTLFFIDSLFKKIRFLYNNYTYSLFYDEEIYNFSKIRILGYKSENLILYNTNSSIKKIKFPNIKLLVNNNSELINFIQKEEIKI